MSAETVNSYTDYTEGARAACAWVERGSFRVDRSLLRLYISRVGPAKGRVVGVGLLRPSGVIEDIIRIDNDDTGKGIHFNAKNISNTSQKLAATVTQTVAMYAYDRSNLYFQYLHALETLDAENIWDWWRTGQFGERPRWLLSERRMD